MTTVVKEEGGQGEVEREEGREDGRGCSERPRGSVTVVAASGGPENTSSLFNINPVWWSWTRRRGRGWGGRWGRPDTKREWQLLTQNWKLQMQKSRCWKLSQKPRKYKQRETWQTMEGEGEISNRQAGLITLSLQRQPGLMKMTVMRRRRKKKQKKTEIVLLKRSLQSTILSLDSHVPVFSSLVSHNFFAVLFVFVLLFSHFWMKVMASLLSSFLIVNFHNMKDIYLAVVSSMIQELLRVVATQHAYYGQESSCLCFVSFHPFSAPSIPPSISEDLSLLFLFWFLFFCFILLGTLRASILWCSIASMLLMWCVCHFARVKIVICFSAVLAMRLANSGISAWSIAFIPSKVRKKRGGKERGPKGRVDEFLSLNESIKRKE